MTTPPYPQNPYPQNPYPQDPYIQHYGGRNPYDPNDVFAPATMGKRLAAYIIDGLIGGLIGTGVIIIAAMTTTNLMDAVDTTTQLGDDELQFTNAGLFLILVIIGQAAPFLLLWLLEGTLGTTLGKLIFGLKVIPWDINTPVNPAQTPVPGLGKAGARNLWMLLDIIPVAGAFAWIAYAIGIGVTGANSTQRLSFNDTWSKTRVISTR